MSVSVQGSCGKGFEGTSYHFEAWLVVFGDLHFRDRKPQRRLSALYRLVTNHVAYLCQDASSLSQRRNMVYRIEPNDDGSVPSIASGASARFATVEDVERSLQRSGYADLRGIRCLMEDGRVTLQGIVPSFHMKQLAQCAAKRVVGVLAVKNEIIVSQ
ncbi:MAG TPA: BON domain-containing protein [Planctomycetaceae bacterium]|nr:BON domain-containing protein [Planctomycetaceae bacterium]